MYVGGGGATRAGVVECDRRLVLQFHHVALLLHLQSLKTVGKKASPAFPFRKLPPEQDNNIYRRVLNIRQTMRDFLFGWGLCKEAKGTAE